MALPKVGDGYQVTDGNVNEGTKVGVSGGSLGFYGVTPVAKASAITALVTTPTATDIATAVNSIITALKNVGVTA
jgi:hypothetical protein